MANKGLIIKAACEYLNNDQVEVARNLLENKYPFEYKEYNKRSCTLKQSLDIFVRDGFIDRYSGDKLIFPGALKILSEIFPDEFPYHKNWKMSECHIAYWELVPTIDHIVPIARGGADNEENWICTSFIKNAAKSNFTIEELDWKIIPAGDIEEWDGMLMWFVSYIKEHKLLLKDNYIKKWFDVAVKID